MARRKWTSEEAWKAVTEHAGVIRTAVNLVITRSRSNNDRADDVVSEVNLYLHGSLTSGQYDPRYKLSTYCGATAKGLAKGLLEKAKGATCAEEMRVKKSLSVKANSRFNKSDEGLRSQYVKSVNESATAAREAVSVLRERLALAMLDMDARTRSRVLERLAAIRKSGNNAVKTGKSLGCTHQAVSSSLYRLREKILRIEEARRGKAE